MNHKHCNTATVTLQNFKQYILSHCGHAANIGKQEMYYFKPHTYSSIVNLKHCNIVRVPFQYALDSAGPLYSYALQSVGIWVHHCMVIARYEGLVRPFLNCRAISSHSTSVDLEEVGLLIYCFIVIY